jgi:hypothetical protein
MANLRANNVCGTDGRNAITGSVEIDGTGDYLSIPNTSDFRLGNSDFTVEGWAYLSAFGTNRTLFALFENATARRSYQLEVRTTGTVRFEWWYDGSTANNIDSASGIISLGSWSHYAVVRNGSTITLYINGVSANSSNVGTNSFFENTTEPFLIGGNLQSAVFSQSWQGFVSNFRLIKGTALYTSDFIPPTRKLTRLPGTVLLCCQDNTSVTTEATGKTITANGNPAARRFVPQVGSDGGLVFDGATKVNTQNYFYLSTGVTENREPAFPGADAASARGIFAGGYGPTNVIDYITISTTGNAADFGDLIGSTANPGAVASPTRGVFAGGYVAPAVANTIQYITISTTGNAADFGDLTSTRNNVAGCSSSTRGILAGGAPNINTIEYITIFSLGNSIDFGDLIVVRSNAGGCSSPTRGIFAGGDTAPTGFTNSIDYVTIATTANALDFGDLSASKDPAACSNNVRGLFAGGRAPTAINVIEYITIASTGGVTDFGDLSGVRRFLEGTASSTRGVFGGGYTTSPASASVNIIEYVTILTTGNAVDFGDLTLSRFSLSALSNGHGGLG